MNSVKQHAIKILMVSVLAIGLFGCGIGSICDAMLGTSTSLDADAYKAGTTASGVTPIGTKVASSGDTVLKGSSICGK